MITAHKIKLARQLKGIPMKDMADQLDMDYSTYSRLERGQTKLLEETVEALLIALEMPRDLVENIESVNLNVPPKPDLLKDFAYLSETIAQNNRLLQNLLNLLNEARNERR